jgi:hypothetical protein
METIKINRWLSVAALENTMISIAEQAVQEALKKGALELKPIL